MKLDTSHRKEKRQIRERRKIIKKDIANRVFSKSMGRGLRNTFGKRNWKFFEMYGKLLEMAETGSVIGEDYRKDFRKASGRIYQMVENEWIQGEFKSIVRPATRKLKKLKSRENKEGKSVNQRKVRKRAQEIASDLVSVIEALCDEAGIQINLKQISGVRGEWYKFKEGRSDRIGVDEEKRAEKREEAINQLFSNYNYRTLRKAFQRQGRKFFEMYPLLYLVYKGDYELLGDDVREFYESYKHIAKRLENETLKEDLHAEVFNLRKLFRKMIRRDLKRNKEQRKIRDLKEKLLNMMERLMAEKDMYVKKKRVEKYWYKLNKARKAEEELAKLRQEDPEHAKLKEKEKELFSKAKDKIKRKIRRDGMEVERTAMLGKPVLKGVDPASGEEFVYDVHSQEPIPVEEWYEERKSYLSSMDKLANWRLQSVEIDNLRKFDDDVVDSAKAEQKVQEVAITDDQRKQNGLTRVVPTVEVDGDKVIAEGRYKGVTVDSMTNELGQMIEGGGTTFDAQGNEVKIEQRNEEGDLEIEGYTEPYLTVADDGSLYLGVSGGNDWTDIRNEIRNLADNTPWVEYMEGTGQEEFKIEPEAFNEIKGMMPGSLLMSNEATKKLKEWHKERKVREEVMTDERLERFNEDNLGGFKEDISLYKKQKEAIAFLDERGDNGMLAMETGTGKTLSSMAHIRKLINDGEMGNNDKVLWVAPAKIVGNFKEQVGKLMEKPYDFKVGNKNDVNNPSEYDVDALSYNKFQGLDSGQYEPEEEVLKEGEEWSMDEYVAVYFDEAHKKLAKNTKSKTSMAAQKDHPRKVMLTASPLNKSPKEAYALTKIADNVKMHRNDRRKEMRDFLKVHCEQVGNRYVSLSEDPKRKESFRSWIKENMFYANKRGIDEYDLKDKKKSSKSVTMSDQITDEYKDALKDLKSELDEFRKGINNLNQKKRNGADPEEIEEKKTEMAMNIGSKSSFNETMTKLFKLANMPDKVIDGAENPKLEQCVSEIENSDPDSMNRTVLFCKNTETAQYYAEKMSKKMPGQKVAAGLASKARVEFWKDGSLEEEITPSGTQSSVEILEEKVKPAESDISICVLMDSYSQGLNLQTFNKVLHVDRDKWENEQLKQRTARVWRNGQDKAVEEVKIDAAIPEDKQTNYAENTIDELMEIVNQTQDEMFNEMIKASEGQEIKTGLGDVEFKKSSYFSTDKRLAKLEMSPYIEDQVDIKESLGDDNMHTSDDPRSKAIEEYKQNNEVQ